MTRGSIATGDVVTYTGPIKLAGMTPIGDNATVLCTQGHTLAYIQFPQGLKLVVDQSEVESI